MLPKAKCILVDISVGYNIPLFRKNYKGFF